MAAHKVNHRKAYLARWRASHLGFRDAYNHRLQMSRCPKRAYLVEILGIRVRVNEFSAFLNGREKEK